MTFSFAKHTILVHRTHRWMQKSQYNSAGSNRASEHEDQRRTEPIRRNARQPIADREQGRGDQIVSLLE